MTIDVRSYLALEVGLTRKLIKEWRLLSAGTYADIVHAVHNEKWDKARQLVQEIDLRKVGDDNKEYIKHALLSCAVYGANMANTDGPTFVGVGTYDQKLDGIVSAFLVGLEFSATKMARDSALQLIAKAEADLHPLALVTKDDVSDADLASGGKVNPQMGFASMLGKKPGKKKRKLIDSLVVKGEPRPLYVHRKLLNGQDLVDWAKLHGFEVTMEASDMHTTVAYSKEAFKWPAVDQHTPSLTVTGGNRVVKPLGDGGAVVLTFESQQLEGDWQDILDAGASWDYEGYTPHVTITWKDPGFDVSQLKPYDGPLLFGPEVFEDLNDDWKDTVVEKADSTGRYVQDFVSFAEGGDASLQLFASLNASRLATWGFVAESEMMGKLTYRLSAVLDGRTSAFCRWINGHVFEISAAKELIDEALSAQDPAALKGIQPWPDQSKAGIAAAKHMTTEQLVAAGWHIPPFHPGCRTICVNVHSVDDADTPMPTAPPGEGKQTPISPQVFEALGIKMTAEMLQHWNDFVGLNPAKVLAEMTGMKESELLDGALTKHAIDVNDDGDISFQVKGSLGNTDETYDIRTFLDPYTGTFYVNQADFAAGDVSAASKFLAGVFNATIELGQDIGASQVVLEAGGAAYAYAKMGFLPDAGDWQTVRGDLMDRLEEGDLKDVLASFNDDERHLILNLLNNNDESSLQVLIDLPLDYEGRPIGDLLLEGVNVPMHLDLTDDNAVARAKEFLGAV